EGLQDGRYADGTIEQQARDLYHTALHVDELETANRQALDAELLAIHRITDKASLSASIGRLHRLGASSAWSVIVDADDKDSKVGILRIDQRQAFTLPGREYYLDKTANMRAVRTKYLAHLETVLLLFGTAASKAHAQSILDFETEIAKHSRPQADLRDPEAN